MRIHSFFHVPFEGLGSIADWAAVRGHVVTATPWYGGGAAPSPEAYDWLIVMGGPMGVYDEGEYPWLVDEKRAIAAAIGAGKRVLGVCLGAQLIADVLGARVSRNPHREIGWFPIELASEGASTRTGRSLAPIARGSQTPAPVFHWHGDTFDLPAGAVHVARSEACEHQAFSLDDRVVGLQFHLETTPASAAELIGNCPGDLVAGPYVQSAETMVADAGRFLRINAVMHALLDALTRS
ncbi:amidotransferase [Candidatus Binatia bacterium]|nr:amidotransferase [Candidatus Binatia bacterium]